MIETKTYGYLIDIVEYRYFRSVDEKNLQAVLDCFNEDAVLTEVTSQTVHRGRDEGIKKMFENLFENFKATTHKHFHHVVDPENGRVASQFTVDFWGLKGEEFAYTNCDFWYLENGKFQDVYVYMSDENVLV
jgi:ketosteroid isomerase-like protein